MLSWTVPWFLVQSCQYLHFFQAATLKFFRDWRIPQGLHSIRHPVSLCIFSWSVWHLVSSMKVKLSVKPLKMTVISWKIWGRVGIPQTTDSKQHQLPKAEKAHKKIKSSLKRKTSGTHESIHANHLSMSAQVRWLQKCSSFPEVSDKNS